MNYNKKYADNGLCGYCGKNPPEVGIQKCSICKQKASLYQKKNKQKNIDLGICIYCRKEKVEINLRGCVSCNQKNTKNVLKTKKENPEKVKDWQKKANKTRCQFRLDNALCVQCGNDKEDNGNLQYCNNCVIYRRKAQKDYHEKYPEKAKIYRDQLRKDVIEKYGNKCDCCGEDHIEFMAIDHKNNDGNIERKKLYGENNSGGTYSWYLKLKREPKRDDLRVLCHNCNIAIAFYGICPHSIKNKDKANE